MARSDWSPGPAPPAPGAAAPWSDSRERGGRRWTPWCLDGEASSALIRPGHVLVDGSGMRA